MMSQCSFLSEASLSLPSHNSLLMVQIPDHRLLFSHKDHGYEHLIHLSAVVTCSLVHKHVEVSRSLYVSLSLSVLIFLFEFTLMRCDISDTWFRIWDYL